MKDKRVTLSENDMQNLTNAMYMYIDKLREAYISAPSIAAAERMGLAIATLDHLKSTK